MESNVVVLEEGRVVRLFGDRSERLRDTSAPSNDVRRPVAPAADEVRARLDAGIGRALFEPLASIAAAAGVLRHEVSAAQGGQVEAIARSAALAEEMTRDLLDFVRSVFGGIGIVRRRIDLKILCERVVDAVYRANPERSMVFASDRRVEGEWDPDAVEALLSKLLASAVAFATGRPPIRIGLQATAAGAVLEVWSPGFVADGPVRTALFEPFASGPPTVRPSQQGLGLGLYLAREIARAHGGWVDVHGENGAGITLSATLPRADS